MEVITKIKNEFEMFLFTKSMLETVVNNKTNDNYEKKKSTCTKPQSPYYLLLRGS